MDEDAEAAEGGGVMNISIDIADYLSHEEVRKIAIEELRNAFREELRYEADAERVLSNLTHEYIFREVCSNIYGMEDAEERIREKVRETIEGDGVRYAVFRRANAWDRTESPAVKILDEVLKDSRPLIEAEVKKRIEQYHFSEVQEAIEDTVYEVICRRLRGVE